MPVLRMTTPCISLGHLYTYAHHPYGGSNKSRLKIGKYLQYYIFKPLI